MGQELKQGNVTAKEMLTSGVDVESLDLLGAIKLADPSQWRTRAECAVEWELRMENVTALEMLMKAAGAE